MTAEPSGQVRPEPPLRVGLVTCRELPEPDPDSDLLLASLQQAGVEAELLAWNDPDAASPGVFDRLILRSSWDYHLFPAEFMAWIDEAARLTCLSNSAPIVYWNVHKRYLESLAAAGIRTVPTAWLRRGTEASLRRILEENGWTDFVVKPSISASSWQTYRFRVEHHELAQAESILEELLPDRDMMIQPYVRGVDTGGEKAVMWIDGELTHAVRKKTRFVGQTEFVAGVTEISPKEWAIAERSVAFAAAESGGWPLYARVDLMPDEEGPMVSELELIEPSLYLAQSPAALDRLVLAIATAPAS